MKTILKPVCIVILLAVTAAACQAAETTSTSSSSAAATAGQSADARIADLQRQLELQQEKIDRLEAKVGFPTTMIGWTWFLIGLIGEGVFFLRFVVQWWASERKKRTVVPMAFWHLSLIGTALVLAFAVFAWQPVFILAYSLNIFLYVRNLYIARRTPAMAELAEKESE